MTSKWAGQTAGFFVVATLLLMLSGCSPGESDAAVAEDDDEDSMPVAGYEIEPRDLSRIARMSGTVEPVKQIRVKAYADGVLTTLNVREGDRVEAGELLAATELAEFRAELGRARAEINKLQQELERKRPLAEQEAIQSAEVEQLESDLEIAKRDADIWQTRIELGRMTAPRDAVVTNRYVDPGSSVSANEEVLELADMSTLVIPVRMSERDVGAIDREASLEVTVDAYPDHPLEATIRRVFPTADADSRRVTVELELGEIPEEIDVKPGYRARAAIEVDRRRDRVAVPSPSLLASDGDDQIVYVIENDELVERSVETGVERRNWTEITEGLQPGEVIVGTNPTNLREGTRVHVSQWVGQE